MKPQCNTSADCLRELARVMDQFGIEYHVTALQSVYVREQGRRWTDLFPAFTCPKDWQFAIAEVEGKPVFPDSKVYFRGEEWLIRKYENASAVLLMRERDRAVHCWVEVSDLSWNPPKPSTVMVELKVEDAEKMSRDANERLAGTYAYDRVGLACKKALEQIK